VQATERQRTNSNPVDTIRFPTATTTPQDKPWVERRRSSTPDPHLQPRKGTNCSAAWMERISTAIVNHVQVQAFAGGARPPTRRRAQGHVRRGRTSPACSSSLFTATRARRHCPEGGLDIAREQICQHRKGQHHFGRTCPSEPPEPTACGPARRVNTSGLADTGLTSKSPIETRSAGDAKNRQCCRLG